MDIAIDIAIDRWIDKGIESAAILGNFLLLRNDE